MVTRLLICISLMLALITNVGCKKCNDKESIITNCHFKYWDLYVAGQKNRVGSYRFEKDGSCYYLKWSYDIKKRVFFYSDDVVVSNGWSLINKDSIAINGCSPTYQINSISKDSIILKYKYLAVSDDGKEYYTFKVNRLYPSADQSDNFNFDSLKKAVNSPYFYKKLQCN